MDWFERLTGFRESSYLETRAKLEVSGEYLHSLVNGKSYGIGSLQLISLQSLKKRGAGEGEPGGFAQAWSLATSANCTGAQRSLARCFRSPPSSTCWR